MGSLVPQPNLMCNLQLLQLLQTKLPPGWEHTCLHGSGLASSSPCSHFLSPNGMTFTSMDEVLSYNRELETERLMKEQKEVKVEKVKKLASAYDPISSALKNSFHGGPKKSLDSRIESTLQKSMLMTVSFDDPVKQVPSLSPSQKSKYTVLKLKKVEKKVKKVEKKGDLNMSIASNKRARGNGGENMSEEEGDMEHKRSRTREETEGGWRKIHRLVEEQSAKDEACKLEVEELKKSAQEKDDLLASKDVEIQRLLEKQCANNEACKTKVEELKKNARENDETILKLVEEQSAKDE